MQLRWMDWLWFLITFAGFQTVPTTEVTATQLMTKFLGINPTNTRRKRAASLYLNDVVIVMDGSSSIGRCEFERGRAAMMNLILAASKRTGADEKFAAVTFSNSASVNFKFLPYSAAQQQLMRISYPGGGSNTQAGLEMAKTLFQDSSAGEINNIKHAIMELSNWKYFKHYYYYSYYYFYYYYYYYYYYYWPV